jgi:hypothetical protein
MALGPRDCPSPGVPWSEAHVMEFMGLWRWDQGIGGVGVGGGWGGVGD